MKLWKISGVLISSVVMMACGGGGDQAGDVDEFTTYPTDFTFWVFPEQPGQRSCRAGGGGGGRSIDVTIVGGQEPFRIINNYPARLQVDKTEVRGKDPSFRVTSLGGCYDLSILVLDYHSRQAVVQIKSEDVEPAATPTVN